MQGDIRPRVVRIIDDDVRLGAVIGHGDEVDSGLPAFAQCLGHAGERVARVQARRSHQMRPDISVTESEPCGLDAVRGELFLGAECLVEAAPATLGVDSLSEGVHHGVQIGAHPQPVDPDVVPGVPDHGDLGGPGEPGVDRLARNRIVGGFLNVVTKSAKEARATDSPGESGDAHPCIQPLRRRLPSEGDPPDGPTGLPD